MFTKDILFGMNIVSLAGFGVMELRLTLRRMAQAGAPLCIGLICAGASSATDSIPQAASVNRESAEPTGCVWALVH